jgi:hypothetical protein
MFNPEILRRRKREIGFRLLNLIIKWKLGYKWRFKTRRNGFNLSKMILRVSLINRLMLMPWFLSIKGKGKSLRKFPKRI